MQPCAQSHALRINRDHCLFAWHLSVLKTNVSTCRLPSLVTDACTYIHLINCVNTGYMFKSAVYRLDLRNSLSGGEMSYPLFAPFVSVICISQLHMELQQPTFTLWQFPTGDALSALADSQEAAPAMAVGAEEAVFAAGTQKLRVEGQVLRWHLANDSAESIPALDYIHMLERENSELKRQVLTDRP